MEIDWRSKKKWLLFIFLKSSIFAKEFLWETQTFLSGKDVSFFLSAVIFATLIFASWLHCVATPSNFWLQRTLENFLRKSQTFPRYVTSSPNLGLSNGTKIITCGSLEKNRHAYFKKRYPHLPFVSYFSSLILCIECEVSKIVKKMGGLLPAFCLYFPSWKQLLF